MDAVSVRDAQTRKMVKNASGVNAKIVLDPTFYMISRRKWKLLK